MTEPSLTERLKKHTSSSFIKSKDPYFYFNNSNTNITINNNNILINKNKFEKEPEANSDEDENEGEDSVSNEFHSPKMKSFARMTKTSFNNLFLKINTIEEYPINSKLKELVNNFPSNEETKVEFNLLNLINLAINSNYFLLNDSKFKIATEYLKFAK